MQVSSIAGAEGRSLGMGVYHQIAFAVEGDVGSADANGFGAAGAAGLTMAGHGSNKAVVFGDRHQISTGGGDGGICGVSKHTDTAAVVAGE